MKAKYWFYGIVVLQLLFLVGEYAHYERKLTSGRVVLLKVDPIDPRSLFLGDYMYLSYDISTLGRGGLPLKKSIVNSFTHDDPAIAVLRPDTPVARLVEVLRDMPPARDPDKVYLRGRVFSWGEGQVMIHYGIERYYIPEARQQQVYDLGNRLWKERGKVVLVVEAGVDPSGRAVIRRVLLDGKPLPF